MLDTGFRGDPSMRPSENVCSWQHGEVRLKLAMALIPRLISAEG
jgi:hypothetical protein